MVEKVLHTGGNSKINVKGIVRKVKVIKMVNTWPKKRRIHFGRKRKDSGIQRYSFTCSFSLSLLMLSLLSLRLPFFGDGITNKQS